MNNMWSNPPYYRQPSSWSGNTSRESTRSWPDRGGYPQAGFGIYESCQLQQPEYLGWQEEPAYWEARQPVLWMPEQDDEWENEQDMEYFLEMYPNQVKAMRRHVEGLCDHFDYDGSPLYDEFPDRIAMLRMRDMILQNAEKDETLFGKQGYFGEPGCTAAKDMAEILLYHEAALRRRRRRGML